MKKLYRFFLGFIQRVIQVYYRCHRNNGKVLMFHSINKFGNLDNITPETFHSFTCYLKNNYYIKDISELKKRSEYSNKRIFLTFDDGFESVYTIAYPIFKKYKIPFTIFITSKFLDSTNYISSKQLIELSDDKLCTIGYHTISHKLTRFLSKDQQYREIISGKYKIEKIINKKIEYFAFPYGSCFAVSNNNILFAKKGGYKAVFMTYQSHISYQLLRKDKAVPRININELIAKGWLNGSIN